MRRIISVLLALALVLGFSLVMATPVMAQSWLTGWSYRIKITIDSAKVDESLTHFPVLLKLGSSVGITGADVTSIFDEVGPNSKKIAVTKSDGTTQVYCEIERWDHTTKVAELWVSRSDLVIDKDTDTVLYLYYDNSRADNTTWVGETGTTPLRMSGIAILSEFGTRRTDPPRQCSTAPRMLTMELKRVITNHRK